MGKISLSGSQKKTLQFQQKRFLENCHIEKDNNRNHSNEIGLKKILQSIKDNHHLEILLYVEDIHHLVQINVWDLNQCLDLRNLKK